MTFDIDSRMDQWTAANHSQHTDQTESILKAGQDNLDELFSEETATQAAKVPREANSKRADMKQEIFDGYSSNREKAERSADYDLAENQMQKKGVKEGPLGYPRPDLSHGMTPAAGEEKLTPDHLLDWMFFFADTGDFELANNLLKAIRGKFPEYYTENFDDSWDDFQFSDGTWGGE